MQLWTLYSQFQTAIQFNDLATAEILLKQGIDCDSRFGLNRIPALCMSCKSGNYQLVRLLIEHGCSVNQADENGQTALHYACNYLSVDIAKLLVQNRANLNAVNLYGFTPLHLAVQHNSIDLVRLIAESGASLEKRDANGQTPLLIGCSLNHYEIVKYLLSKGANVNVIDKDENTPLLCSINAGLNLNPALVKLLLNAGADPNHCNKAGLTPLITTIRRSSDHIMDGQETVQALIDHDCDINIKDFQAPWCGENALNISINRNQDSITEKLIRSGANVNQISISGQSPFVRLVKDGKIDLAKLIVASGANIRNEDLKHIENDREKVAQNDKELFEHIYVRTPIFPMLKHLSRTKLRIWLGRHADNVIKEMQLPFIIRKYLLLEEL